MLYTKRNIAKNKGFFSFPVAHKGNEMLVLAYDGNEQQLRGAAV